MPGEFSSVGAGYALDLLTGRATNPFSASSRTTYLVLLTSAPTDSTTLATMAEISTAGYARQSLTWSVPAGDPRSTNNTALVTFGPFTADPPNITHCALVSASSGTVGDFIMFWTLDVAKDPAINESLNFAATTGVVMTLD